MTKNNHKVAVVPLGGLGEIGKNMMAVRYDKEIVIIDVGSAFPEEEMLGVDTVIPDMSYLIENKDQIKGVILTHGHEEHIGALPYLLRILDIPVYGSELTVALAKLHLRQHKLEKKSKLIVVEPGKQFRVGSIACQLVRVNHDLADSCAVAIKTHLGWIIHTGDFKVDYTPFDVQGTDLEKFGEMGRDGVLLLLSDSSNAELRGHSISEQEIGQRVEQLFRNAPGRLLVAIHDTDLYRLQQMVELATQYNRKLCIHSVRLEQIINVAVEAGSLSIPQEIMVDISDIQKLPAEQVVLVTSSSPGEPPLGYLTGSLSQAFKVQQQDTVVLAGSFLPGGAKNMAKAIDQLYRQGAAAVYDAITRGSITGHAGQDELKLMISLTNPRYIMPIHGEIRHLVHHRDLALSMGYGEEDVFVMENGYVLEITATEASITGRVAAGKTLVDGLGVGDVGNIVLRDRKQLSQDGLIIAVVTISKHGGCLVAGPDLVSRGFVYVKESETLIEEAKERVRQSLEQCRDNNVFDWPSIKAEVRDTLGKFVYEKTRRRPMILPIIMEV